MYLSITQDLREFIASQGPDNSYHYDTHYIAENQIFKIKLFGYGFVVLNMLQGVYILGFHCVQNEKVMHFT